jgi:hypothetical protein
MERDHDKYRLTQKQIEEVRKAQIEVRNGGIASDEEVTNLWNSFLKR